MSCWTWGGDDDKTRPALGRNRSLAEAMGGNALVVPRMVRVPVSVQFERVTCGGAHCIAVTTGGLAYSWGWNRKGQLGDGTTASRPSPRQIPLFMAPGIRVGAIAAGAAHSAVLVEFDAERARAPSRSAATPLDTSLVRVHSTLGKVQCYTWGAGKSFQLGYAVQHETNFACPTPRPVDTLGPMLEDDELALFGRHGVSSRQSTLSCGAAHTALVAAHGSIVTWGANGYGQCGRASVAPQVEPARPRFFADETLSAVACGGVHTLVLTAGGRVLSFGSNHAGQLGAGSLSLAAQPVPQFVGMPFGATVAQIECGEETSCALLANGALLTWGFGGCGQLGHATRRSLKQPTQVRCDPLQHVACGGGHTVGVTTSGAVLRWGYEGGWETLQEALKSAGAAGADESALSGAVSGLVTRPTKAPLESAEMAAAGALRLAHSVAAGRRFVVVLADALTPMAPRTASMLIQSAVRERQKRMAALRSGRQRVAANVICKRATEFLVRRELSRAAGVDAAAYRNLMALRLQAHLRRRAQRHTLATLRRADLQLKALAEARRQREEEKDLERAVTLTRTNRAFGHGVLMRSVNGTMRSVGGGFVPVPPVGGPQGSPRTPRRSRTKTSAANPTTPANGALRSPAKGKGVVAGSPKVAAGRG